jgi:tetratricopeptide (TPR) repeat protein
LQLIARVRLAQQVQLFFLGRTEDAIDAARLGADAAAAAGDRRTQQRAVVARIAAETHGATPVPVATMTCEQQLPHLGQPWSRSFACQKLARLYAEAGRFDDARAAYAEAKELALEYGLRMRRGVQTQDGAEIDLLAGDARAAERELREGYAVLAELGETGFRSTVAGLLGESLLAQGRIDEALAAAEDALELAQADDPHTIAIAKAVQARVAAARDDAGAAVRLAAEAVAATHGTDYLDSRASALLALAHASIAAGDSSTAAAAAAEAVDLYARKGNVVRLAAARALLESAGVAA